MIVEKDEYEDFRKLQNIKEETKNYLLSENLENETDIGSLVKKVNSTDKIIGQRWKISPTKKKHPETAKNRE